MKKNMKEIALGVAIAVALPLIFLLSAGCSMNTPAQPDGFSVGLSETDPEIVISWNLTSLESVESSNQQISHGTIIERKTENSGYSEVYRDIAGEAKSWVDNANGGLKRGVYITYRIAHYNHAGIGTWTSGKSVILPAIEPYALTPPDWIIGLWEDANDFYIWTFQEDTVTGSYGNVARDFKEENIQFAKEGKKDTGYAQVEATSSKYKIIKYDEKVAGATYTYLKTSDLTLDFSYSSPTVDEYTIALNKQ